jgi:hypothetical protein
VLAVTGFNYSGVDRSMTFSARASEFFWSNGSAWGSCSLERTAQGMNVELSVLHGRLSLSRFILREFGDMQFGEILLIRAPQKVKFTVSE